MSDKLTIFNGRLRVDTCGGPLVLSPKPGGDEPCCCGGGDISIEICNSNAITDDDWRVELNGTNIGTHSAPTNSLAGTVFRSQSTIPGRGCGSITHINFSESVLKPGSNSILMTITALYFAANFGTVRVLRWKKNSAGDYVEDSVLLDATYGGGSIIGLTNSFTFNIDAV